MKMTFVKCIRQCIETGTTLRLFLKDTKKSKLFTSLYNGKAIMHAHNRRYIQIIPTISSRGATKILLASRWSMCKASRRTFLYPIRGTHSRRSQVFSVRSVTHLEDTSSSAHTPSTYTFLRDLCKQITAGRKRARVVVLFSFLTSVTEQTSKTLQAQRQTAVVARGDCDALRLIRPLTNHSVRDIYEFIARCNVVVRTYILS